MIVSDASPLILLARIGRLDLLRRLHKTVVVPQSVWGEVAGTARSGGEFSVLEHASGLYVEIRNLSRGEQGASAVLQQAARLATGEADTIALAESLGVTLLSDDALAVRVARSRGVRTRWTTAIISDAFRSGLVGREEARNAIEDLVQHGLWIGQAVLLRIFAALGDG